MPQHISNRRPPEKDWKVKYVTVVTMEKIVGNVLKNQSSGKKWLISEAIIDLVKIYVDCAGEEVLS